MVEIITQKIDRLLSELSEEARSYYLPGINNESLTFRSITLHEQDYVHSKKCYSAIEGDSAPKHSCSPRRRMAKVENNGTFSFIIPKRVEYDSEPSVADLELDERTKAIMEEFDALMRKHGLNVEEVEILLVRNVKLSRLRITAKNEILLEDFDRKEVKMDTLTKAVFFLYLRHPEGIRYKELSDHQRELEEIYSSITGREDLDSIRKSVEDLCDPLNNSINEKVSKVKKAFRDVVNDRVAKFYYIDGEKGTAKRIALKRSYVIQG